MMRYEIGKRYWRIKSDGGIYEFIIMKGTREARPGNDGKVYYMDTYYDDKDAKVLTDGTNMPPGLMPNLDLIFDSEQKALEFLIERLQKRTMTLINEKEWGNESGK